MGFSKTNQKYAKTAKLAQDYKGLMPAQCLPETHFRASSLHMNASYLSHLRFSQPLVGLGTTRKRLYFFISPYQNTQHNKHRKCNRDGKAETSK